MPLKIPASDEASLVLAATKAIQKTGAWQAMGGLYGIQHSWGKDTLEGLEEGFVKALKRHLDDGGLNSYLRHFLTIRFLNNGHQLPDKSKRLVSFSEFENPLDVSQELVTTLKSLPFKYELAVRASHPLSKLFYKADTDFAVSDRLRIVSSEIAREVIPTSHGIKSVDEWIKGGSPDNATVSDNSLYFLYRASGCMSDRYDSRLAREFSDELRAFYGACFAYDILYDYGDSSSGEMVPRIFGYTDGNSSSQELAYTQNVDTDLIRATYVETSLDFDKIVKDGGQLEELFLPIKNMFRSADSLRLKTAASWLLRANQSAREMDRVLESTIALEVLLGDKDASDRVGLSKLMANRCAYSLGTSASERKKLMEFFIRFYKVRSDIVHSGTFKVSEAERAVVAQGLDLAHRVLKHEINVNSSTDQPD
jgi:hypothetical protein